MCRELSEAPSGLPSLLPKTSCGSLQYSCPASIPRKMSRLIIICGPIVSILAGLAIEEMMFDDMVEPSRHSVAQFHLRNLLVASTPRPKDFFTL